MGFYYMLKHTLLYSAILLSSCTSIKFDTSEINGQKFTFIPHLVESLPANIIGLHKYDPSSDIHHIYLIESEFPQCLEHEILHVMFKNWHDGRTSSEFCYNN